MKMKLSRRRFLTFLAGAPVALAALDRLSVPAQAAPAGLSSAELVLSPSDLVAAEQRGIMATSGGLSLGRGRGSFVSRPFLAPQPFVAIGSWWQIQLPEGATLRLWVRTSADGIDWSEWEPIVPEHNQVPGAKLFGTLVFARRPELQRFVQCRGELTASSAANLERLGLVVIADGVPTPARSASITPAAVASPTIVGRGAWGCPDGANSPRWTPVYAPARHAILHHTVTTNSAVDWKQQVRIIWNYHANNLGWGDIGYNFLIDPAGTVYEGRAGGEDVVGGHAYGFNSGTFGIAFLGTFTSQLPTEAARLAAARLIAYRHSRRQVNPTGSGPITVQRECGALMVTKPYVAGHRDLAGHACSSEDPGSTSCPGDQFYPLLAQVRQQSLQAMVGVFITKIEFPRTAIGPDGRLEVRLTVWNNTDTIVFSDDATPPGYVYRENESFPSKPDKPRYRVGLDCGARNGGVQYPYRWGLGGDLGPGDSRTIPGFIQLASERRTEYWASVVQEWVGFGLPTEQVAVTYDVTPPSATVMALPEAVPGAGVRVRWKGDDAASGVATYDVQYREVGGPWRDWLRETNKTEADFKGELGQRYEFRCRARDLAGNTGTYPESYQAATTLVRPAASLHLPAVRR